MLRNSTMASLLEDLGADVEYLTIMVDRYLDKYLETVSTLSDNFQPIETEAFNRVSNRMFEHLQGIRRDVADEFDMLVAMTDEEDSFFMQLLAKSDITKSLSCPTALIIGVVDSNIASATRKEFA